MGAKTRLRARWVERGADENMFGVLLVRVCLCQITISYEGKFGSRTYVAGLPEVLENGIMRSPLESAIVDYFGTFDCHD